MQAFDINTIITVTHVRLWPLAIYVRSSLFHSNLPSSSPFIQNLPETCKDSVLYIIPHHSRQTSKCTSRAPRSPYDNACWTSAGTLQGRPYHKEGQKWHNSLGDINDFQISCEDTRNCSPAKGQGGHEQEADAQRNLQDAEQHRTRCAAIFLCTAKTVSSPRRALTETYTALYDAKNSIPLLGCTMT